MVLPHHLLCPAATAAVAAEVDEKEVVGMISTISDSGSTTKALATIATSTSMRIAALAVGLRSWKGSASVKMTVLPRQHVAETKSSKSQLHLR